MNKGDRKTAMFMAFHMKIFVGVKSKWNGFLESMFLPNSVHPFFLLFKVLMLQIYMFSTEDPSKFCNFLDA